MISLYRKQQRKGKTTKRKRTSLSWPAEEVSVKSMSSSNGDAFDAQLLPGSTISGENGDANATLKERSIDVFEGDYSIGDAFDSKYMSPRSGHRRSKSTLPGSLSGIRHKELDFSPSTSKSLASRSGSFAAARTRTPPQRSAKISHRHHLRSSLGSSINGSSLLAYQRGMQDEISSSPSSSPYPDDGNLSVQGAGGLPRHNRKILCNRHSQFVPHAEVDVLSYARTGTLFLLVTESGQSKFRCIYLSTEVIPLTLSLVVEDLTHSTSSQSRDDDSEALSGGNGETDSKQTSSAHWLVLPLDRLRDVQIGMSHALFDRGNAPRRLAQASFSISYSSSSSPDSSIKHLGFVAKDLVDFEIWSEALQKLIEMSSKRKQTALIDALVVVVPVRAPNETTALLDIIAAHSGSLHRLGYRGKTHVIGGNKRVGRDTKLPLTQFHVSRTRSSSGGGASPRITRTPSFTRDLDSNVSVPFGEGLEFVDASSPPTMTSLTLIRESKEGSVRPSYLLKLGQANANFRVFYITSDMFFLCWKSKKKAREETRIHFSSVVSLIFGQTSNRFEQRKIPRALAPLCFTLIYDNGNQQLHLMAPSQLAFEIWTEAICQCIRRYRSPRRLSQPLLDVYLHIPPVEDPDPLQAIVKRKFPLPSPK